MESVWGRWGSDKDKVRVAPWGVFSVRSWDCGGGGSGLVEVVVGDFMEGFLVGVLRGDKGDFAGAAE